MDASVFGRRKAGPETRGADESWALLEVGHAELGDARRSRRLARIVTSLARRPTSSVPEACETWADTKAAYRFFSNEDIEAASIINAHSLTTAKRAAEHSVILAIQDTTVFNFTSHEAMRGRGPSGRGRTESYGFFTHSCLAVTSEGTPLGLLGQHSYVRKEGAKKMTERERERKPTSEKKSQRWLDMVESSAKTVPATTRVVAVADREADIFDFFTCAIRNNQDFLVRSSYERATENGYAWKEVASAPIAGEIRTEIPRSGERPPRLATLDVRFAKIQLKPPRHRNEDPLSITIILVEEREPPEAQEAVRWRLYTSLPVTSVEDSARCVKWYSLRWRIERFHYTLKSGCRIEELQLESVDRVERALAAYSIVAWHLSALTYKSRELPNSSSEPLLQPDEWKTLHCLANKTRKLPPKPPSLRDAVRMIAKLGGFLGRKGDGEPGVKVLWRGYRRLREVTLALEIMEVKPDVGNG